MNWRILLSHFLFSILFIMNVDIQTPNFQLGKLKIFNYSLPSRTSPILGVMSAGEPVAITTSFVNSFMSESQKGL